MAMFKDKNGVFAVETTQVLSNDGGTEGSVSLPGHHYSVFKDELENKLLSIDFQEGPVGEVGVNGVTNEVLLCILIDRTEKLNLQYPCDENVQAISHMKDALANFNSRTWKREARGVEGFNKA